MRVGVMGGLLVSVTSYFSFYVLAMDGRGRRLYVLSEDFC